MENYTHDMMDELLVKYLADEATPPEQELVEAWADASEDNRSYFQQFQKLWDESRKIAAAYPVDENKAWHRFQKRIKRSELAAGSIISLKWMRVAAAIVFIAVLFWVINFFLDYPPAQPAIVRFSSINNVKNDTLPDGSIATLNKHSEISYSKNFKSKTRKVKLTGEAFFNVQPDKERPFIIDVNNIEVKVVGTSFNIKSTSGTTEVIVASGTVQVIKGEKIIELKAGERISISVADSISAKEISDDKLYYYYVSRTFVCDNTPLWKLVEKLNEAYDVHIIFGRDELKKIPLNVTFNDESLDLILNIISQTLLVKINRKENEIVLE